METTVKLKYIKQSAKKVRFVLNTIKGSSVGSALNKLDNLNKKAAVSISKAIRSGMANLSNIEGNDSVDQNQFYVSDAYVDQGPTMKRFRPAAMGRAMRILKRSSQLTIVISDDKNKRG